jgi:hydrogenase maturation protease
MRDENQTQDGTIQVKESISQDVAHPASTIIVGLGNPILGDDGVGWRVAEIVANQLLEQSPADPKVVVECLSLGGLSLMENLIGYQRAIIIDAITLNENPQGTIYVRSLDDLPDYACGHLTSTHDTSLKTAISVGQSMGAILPEQVTVVGIESKHVYDFSEELSPLVSAAVPEAVKKVLDLINLDENQNPSEE